MANKNNAMCSICGKEYYMCLSCKDALKLNPWKSYTDTSEHYKVFQIIRGLSTGVYTKEEAKEKFKNVDLSDLENYREHIKVLIKDVIQEKQPKKMVKTPIEKVEDIAETPIQDTNIELPQVELPEVENPIILKRNRSK